MGSRTLDGGSPDGALGGERGAKALHFVLVFRKLT